MLSFRDFEEMIDVPRHHPLEREFAVSADDPTPK